MYRAAMLLPQKEETMEKHRTPMTDQPNMNAEKKRAESSPPATKSEDRLVVLEKPKPKIKEPSLYKVFLINDDYTPMDFVTDILTGVFKKSQDEATQLMLDIHNKGKAVAGIFPFSIAETKVNQVTEKARSQDHPLECIMERA